MFDINHIFFLWVLLLKAPAHVQSGTLFDVFWKDEGVDEMSSIVKSRNISKRSGCENSVNILFNVVLVKDVKDNVI